MRENSQKLHLSFKINKKTHPLRIYVKINKRYPLYDMLKSM